MLSFSPSSCTNPYEMGSVRDWEIYDGESGYIMKTILETYTWSPIIWRSCERKKANFYKADYCALDFDSPEHDLAWAERNFCDMWHIIGTTRSHRVEKGGVSCDRFRIVLKFERSIVRLEDYELNMKMLIEVYGADEACFDGARSFYRCSTIVSTLFTDDAYSLDVEPAPTAAESKKALDRYKAGCRRATGIGLLPTFMNQCLTQHVPGNSRHKPRLRFACEAARAGFSFDEAMALLLKWPIYKDLLIDPAEMAEFERVMADGYKAVEADRLKEMKP